MRDGLQAYCRECAAEYYRQRQEAKGKPVRIRVPVPRGHKRCPDCGEVKPHSEWERNKTSSDGWASYCRDCRAERNRIAYFKRKYGLTPGELDDLKANRRASVASVSQLLQNMLITVTRRVRSVACCASAAMQVWASSRIDRTP